MLNDLAQFHAVVVELDGETYLTGTELVGPAYEAFKAVGLRRPARVQLGDVLRRPPPHSVLVRSPRVPKKALYFKGSQGSRCYYRARSSALGRCGLREGCGAPLQRGTTSQP